MEVDKIEFRNTDDGSVGLYDRGVKDIYHSANGSLTESFDKFISATDFKNFCKNNSSVKILDICFGIGYNTKTAIYSAINSSDNITVTVDALEISSQIAYWSPFVRDALNYPLVNIFLLQYFLSEFDDYAEIITKFFLEESEICSSYFDPSMSLLFKNYFSDRYFYDVKGDLGAFLHNIYYQNISSSMEKPLYPPNDVGIDFHIYFGDARKTSKSLSGGYDFVFLDAFTPHKQPVLWTYEFLSLIKSKMKPSAILSTYTNSTPVRKTFSDLGFNIGKIILSDEQFGTIATLRNDFIKSPLSSFDEGLMHTKAGIPFRDKNLNLSTYQILKNRDIELRNCDIISATEYKRMFADDL